MADLMKAAAHAEIGHLVVIFNIIDKPCRFYSTSGATASLALPAIRLPLIKESRLCRGYEFPHIAAIIRKICLAVSGQRYQRRVMKIIIPEGIYSVPALIDRSNQCRLLRLIFGCDNGTASGSGHTDAFGNLCKNMLFGLVVNILGRVQTETIEVKLLYPIAR